MTEKPSKINNLFRKIERRFTDWVKGKPTGAFSLHLNVRDGGLRGKPKVRLEDEI